MTENQIIQKIRENHYTPFEAMLYIHKCFSKHYKIDFTDCTHESKETTYKIEKMLTALCMPGLECNILIGKTLNNQPYYVNLISMQDDKYAVFGTFCNDTVADASTTDFPNGKGFAHCLFPAYDMRNLRNIVPNTLPQNIPFSLESIFPPTYIHGLKRLYETEPELFDNECFNESVYNEINNSITTASTAFKKNAISKFAVCSKSLILNSTQSIKQSASESES